MRGGRRYLSEVQYRRVRAGNLNVVNSLIRRINSLFRAEISLFYFLGNLDCKLL